MFSGRGGRFFVLTVINAEGVLWIFLAKIICPKKFPPKTGVVTLAVVDVNLGKALTVS